MNDKKIIISLVLMTFIVVGGGIFLFSGSGAQPTMSVSKNAKVMVDQKTYDWGKIPYSGGNVVKTFTIKNTGTDPLQLTNIKTSCACTKAQVIIGSANSPYFSMHTTSSWIGEVPAGKEAKLTVIFDPTFHGPSAVGPMTRIISMQTNDPANSTLEFTLIGNVITGKL